MEADCSVAPWDSCCAVELISSLPEATFADAAAMGEYLKSLGAEPAGRISAARQVDLFRAAFGEPSELDRALSHLR